MLRAILVYGFVGCFVAVAAPLSMLWAAVSRRTEHFYRLGHFCVRAAGWMSGVKVIVRGRSAAHLQRPCLFLSNHESNFDGPLLYYATRQNLRAVIKQEIMKVPILAQVLRRLDFVPVDRSDASRAHAAIDMAAQLLRSGLPFFAFPEGTRSRNGQMGEFKKGVFVLAIKAGVPVIPVAIRNSRRIQSAGSLAVHPGTVEVIFGDPIETSGLEMADRNDLLTQTREAISRNLKE